jgi:hypothetical protein
MLAVVMLAGCASCNPKHKEVEVVDPYMGITANNIVKECPTPHEYHYVPGILVIEVPLQVIRFKDCLSQPDLLVMNFPGEKNETTKAYVHLMMLLYVDSIKETTGAEVEPTLIKESQLTITDSGDPMPDNKVVWFIIYKLAPKVVESTMPDTGSTP